MVKLGDNEEEIKWKGKEKEGDRKSEGKERGDILFKM